MTEGAGPGFAAADGLLAGRVEGTAEAGAAGWRVAGGLDLSTVAAVAVAWGRPLVDAAGAAAGAGFSEGLPWRLAGSDRSLVAAGATGCAGGLVVAAGAGFAKGAGAVFAMAKGGPAGTGG